MPREAQISVAQIILIMQVQYGVVCGELASSDSLFL